MTGWQKVYARGAFEPGRCLARISFRILLGAFGAATYFGHPPPEVLVEDAGLPTPKPVGELPAVGSLGRRDLHQPSANNRGNAINEVFSAAFN